MMWMVYIFSQIANEVPYITPAKRLSNENQGSIDGDFVHHKDEIC